jgi:hypothetical protein
MKNVDEALPDTKSILNRINQYNALFFPVKCEQLLIHHTVKERNCRSISNWKREYRQLPKRRVYQIGLTQCTVSGEIRVSYIFCSLIKYRRLRMVNRMMMKNTKREPPSILLCNKYY